MADEKTYTQEQFDAATEEVVAPLKKKVAELLDEVKAARKGKSIDPEELERRDSTIEELRSELAGAKKTAKDALTAKEKAEQSAKVADEFTHKLLVENGLREQLAANGVTNPVHQKAAMALLGSQVQVVSEGDTRVAKAGDKALADFVKEWSAGDEGKHFVAAPTNSGGGAPGGGKGATGKTMLRSAFDALPPIEQHAFIKDGGVPTDQAA